MSQTYYLVPFAVSSFFLRGLSFFYSYVEHILSYVSYHNEFFIMRVRFSRLTYLKYIFSCASCRDTSLITWVEFFGFPPQAHFVMCLLLWQVSSYISWVFPTHASHVYFILSLAVMNFSLHGSSFLHSRALSIFYLVSLIVKGFFHTFRGGLHILVTFMLFKVIFKVSLCL